MTRRQRDTLFINLILTVAGLGFLWYGANAATALGVFLLILFSKG